MLVQSLLLRLATPHPRRSVMVPGMASALNPLLMRTTADNLPVASSQPVRDVEYCIILDNIIGQLTLIAGWDMATCNQGISRMPPSLGERRLGIPRLAIMRDHLRSQGSWECGRY